MAALLDQLKIKVKKSLGDFKNNSYFNPESSNGQNFWGGKVAEGLGNIQRGIQTYSPKLEAVGQRIQKATMPDFTKPSAVNIAKTFTQFPGMFVGGNLEQIGRVGRTLSNPETIKKAPNFTLGSFVDPSKPSKASIVADVASLVPAMGSIKTLQASNRFKNILPEIRTTLKMLDQNSNLTIQQMQALQETVNKVSPAYKASFAKVLNQPGELRTYAKSLLTAAEEQALNPKLNIGLSVKKLSKAEHDAEKIAREIENKPKAMLKLKKGTHAVSPKGNLNIQQVVGQKIGKQLSKLPLEGGIPIRTTAKQAVSLTPSIEKGQLNINRLNVQGAGKNVLHSQEVQVTPTVIGNKEVIAMARTAKGTTALTDEQMTKLMAQQLKNRQVVVDLTKRFNEAKKSGASNIELGRIMLDMANQSRTARQGGTYAGRLLQAQNIVADQSASPMQKIFALLDNAGVGEEKYLKDGVRVNWENPAEVVSFYRKYVPPKFGEVLDEVRYSNMLSSPLTHITNVASNALQTGVVAPIEKIISGTLDFGKSLLTGSERKYYATAGIDYAGGYVKALPQAFKKAMNVLSGKEISIRPDYEQIPTGSTGVMKAYTIPLRALEAMDQFFRTLVEGGVTNELKKGPQKLSSIKITDLAAKEADRRLFRQAFDPNGELGQGLVLQYFDKWNSAIANLRRLPGGKWILPFLQTPTNILKQGVEYSPLGVTTAIGAKNPTEQISKALIGTGVFMAAYQLAKSGLTSWEAPSGEKERELYYAAGMQPYSVKMGNKWVSFSKLGPLSYPMAMAAALASAEKNNPDKSTIENVGISISGILGFFGDQSYVRSIGDLVDAIQGGVNIGPNALSAEGANLAGQLIPYKSFLTWLGRMTDPIYRKASTLGERLIKDLPGVGSNLEPYADMNGQPSTRDYPVLNAVSPYKVTQEKQPAAGLLQEYQAKKIDKSLSKRADDKFLKGSEKAQKTGNIYRYIDDNGAVKQIDLSFPEPTYKPTGNSTLDKELLTDYRAAITKQKNEIMKALEVEAITEDEAVSLLDKLTSLSSKTKRGKKVSLKTSQIKKVNIKAPAKMPTVKFTKSSSPKLKLSPSRSRQTQKLRLKTLTSPKIKISSA